MAILELSFASGEDSLSVRHFTVDEGLSELFGVKIEARSPNDDLDLDAIVGKPALFRIVSGVSYALVGTRLWTGVCKAMEQVKVEPKGLSTYELTIVPAFWLLSQRRNNRLFQHISIPDIVDRILAEWSLTPIWRVDRERYPRLELRVQYGESDLDFVRRLLEEAGISFYFADDLEKGSQLVLHDAPQNNELRGGPPLVFLDSPGQAQTGEIEHLTEVKIGHEVRPGRHTIRDHDFRRPGFALFSAAPPVEGLEGRYEQYHYRPGAFLVEEPRGGGAALAQAARVAGAAAAVTTDTPVADDKGVARFDHPAGTALAQRGLESRRAGRRRVTFKTNAIDLAPGVVLSMSDHPRADLAPSRRLLVTAFRIEGSPGGEWTLRGAAHFAAEPHRPSQDTPKPRIHGAQSAVVVGPRGEEIYTDEFGRVRVQFHWDREGRLDDDSSIWMRVSQGWAGPGYGVFTVPRIGHEVLVGFLDGDPDCPLVVGRVHNAVAQVPYKLPENKTVSTWRSQSSPGGEGFNEIRFEDAAGREMIFEHAQRDRNQIVRNDTRSAVGGSSTRVVQQKDHTAVGGERTKVVGLNETAAIGLTSTEAVGVSKNTIVGGDESHLVGSKFSVTMARGLGARFARELGRVLAGPLAADLHGPVASLLGRLPMTALGGALGAAVDGPLADLLTRTENAMRGVLDLVDGYANDPGPPPTSFEMVDRKIRFTTGEASIVLDGPNISLFADGNIVLHARGNIAALADGEAAVSATGKVLVQSRANELIVQGGPFVRLNPAAPPVDQPSIDHQIKLKDRLVRDRVCDDCGGPMVIDPDVPGRYVCAAQERLGAALLAGADADPELGVDEGEGAIHPDDILDT